MGLPERASITSVPSSINKEDHILKTVSVCMYVRINYVVKCIVNSEIYLYSAILFLVFLFALYYCFIMLQCLFSFNFSISIVYAYIKELNPR